jgi:hypothetical protein
MDRVTYHERDARQWCATRPPFLDNLHFEQIVKSVMYKTQVEVMDELVEMEIV